MQSHCVGGPPKVIFLISSNSMRKTESVCIYFNFSIHSPMFIDEATIAGLKDQYGQPEHDDFKYSISEDEQKVITGSQKNGRKHDVTLYIIKDEQIIVIAKHFYPPNLFRAPSGGVELGEDFIVGAKREALEETGCKIEIESFLLETSVNFINKGNKVAWNSYVFQARYLSGDFQFTDHNEIREVRMADLKEFETFSKIMHSSTIGGLHYRAALHDAVKPLLDI